MEQRNGFEKDLQCGIGAVRHFVVEGALGHIDFEVQGVTCSVFPAQYY